MNICSAGVVRLKRWGLTIVETDRQKDLISTEIYGGNCASCTKSRSPVAARRCGHLQFESDGGCTGEIVIVGGVFEEGRLG